MGNNYAALERAVIEFSSESYPSVFLLYIYLEIYSAYLNAYSKIYVSRNTENVLEFEMEYNARQETLG